MNKYNWKLIQQDYDSGLSQANLIDKYGMSKATICYAVRRGDLITRTISDAMKLWSTRVSYAGRGKTPEAEKLRRDKISKSAKLRNFGGYVEGSGRGKGGWYNSPIAGKVYLDSSYEFRYARYLDSMGILWSRNVEKFPYYWDGKLRHYTPDFYLMEENRYIETKGYKTDQDEAKWNQFPHPLEVVYKKDLELLEGQADGGLHLI